MILYFLHLFRAFRDAEARIAELNTDFLVQKGRADSQLDARRDAEAQLERIEFELSEWKAQCAAKDAEIARLNGLLIDEAHKVADTMSVHAIGKRFFSKAPAPEANTGPQVQPPVGRPFARAQQYQAMQDTRKSLKEIWDKLPGAEN